MENVLSNHPDCGAQWFVVVSGRWAFSKLFSVEIFPVTCCLGARDVTPFAVYGSVANWVCCFRSFEFLVARRRLVLSVCVCL